MTSIAAFISLLEWSVRLREESMAKLIHIIASYQYLLNQLSDVSQWFERCKCLTKWNTDLEMPYLLGPMLTLQLCMKNNNKIIFMIFPTQSLFLTTRYLPNLGMQFCASFTTILNCKFGTSTPTSSEFSFLHKKSPFIVRPLRAQISPTIKHI